MMLLFIFFKLLFSAVAIRRDLSILFNRTAILGLITFFSLGFQSFIILNKGLGIQGGLIFTNNITQFFHQVIFFLSAFMLQCTGFYPRKLSDTEQTTNKLWSFQMKVLDKLGEQFIIIEYPLILLFVITGATLLISTNDLISIFLCLELQSYGLYLVSTIYRNSELSTTSGLIYFLIGGLSSCFILLSISLLYTNSGASGLDALFMINNMTETNNIYLWYKSNYINFSLLILSIGFLIKISAAPFHFWSPDVYDGLPTIVTMFVAILAKISLLVLLFHIIFFTQNNSFEINWTNSILLSALFSLIIGSIIGLTQFRIKRLFAYSTISHIGFILLALSIASPESFQSFLFYLVQYSLSNMNVFIILIAIGFSLFSYETYNIEIKKLMDKKNSPVQLINQIKGYFYINPLLSICLAITIFSFIGIPPLIGFFGKQMVLSASLDKGFYFLVLIAISTSVIGAAYYLNLIKEIFFYPSEYKVNTSLKNKLNHLRCILKSNMKSLYIINSSTFTLTISSTTLITLLFIFFNKEWLSMGTMLVQMLLTED